MEPEEKEYLDWMIQDGTSKILSLNNKGQIKDMKKPCLHCPYRKDRKNWLTQFFTYFNVGLIRNKTAQYCHMANKKGKTLVCYGAKKCLEGGDNQIVSPIELLNRKPSESPGRDYLNEH